MISQADTKRISLTFFVRYNLESYIENSFVFFRMVLVPEVQENMKS